MNKTIYFSKKKLPSFVIAGLGNPGIQYAKTRHNAGFLAVDTIATHFNLKLEKVKFMASMCQFEFNDSRCIFVKPNTYMNNSGESLNMIVKYFKIPIENVLVLYDDIFIDPSKIKIRKKGSHGGHNGIRSIIDTLSSDRFCRIKIGIGAKPNPDMSLEKWVLSNFTPQENILMNISYNNCVDIFKLFVANKLDMAMNIYNKN